MDFKFENLAKTDEILLKMDILEQKILGAKKWLNVSETAHYLGYSKDYIHKLKDTYFLENKHFYKKLEDYCLIKMNLIVGLLLHKIN